MKYTLTLCFFTLLIISCSSDSDSETEPENDGIDFQFSDGFETNQDNFDELVPLDGSRWSGTQIVNPTGKENSLSLSTIQASEGNQSLAIEVKKSNEVLSKADIEKGGFQAPVNSTVVIEADFYIDSEANIENLLLIDLECCSCWDPSVTDNQCPGIRLAMTGNNDYLSIERGKIAGSTIHQTSYAFPRKEWVSIRWSMKLSSEDNGTNKLYINNELVISVNAMNLPNATTFRQIFAENGIDFELQQPIYYERIQIGATANPDAEDLLLYVDNFSIRISND